MTHCHFAVQSCPTHVQQTGFFLFQAVDYQPNMQDRSAESPGLICQRKRLTAGLTKAQLPHKISKNAIITQKMCSFCVRESETPVELKPVRHNSTEQQLMMSLGPFLPRSLIPAALFSDRAVAHFKPFCAPLHMLALAQPLWESATSLSI